MTTFGKGGLRARLVSLGIGLAFLAVSGKAAILALTPAAEGSVTTVHSQARAEQPRRADIVDRNGELLATSVSVYSLVADPRAIWDPEDVLSQLATVLPGLDVPALTKRLSNRERAFEWVQRGLTPRQRQSVYELGLEGLEFREEQQRAYPRGTLAGHILGYAGLDGEGLAGLEYSQNDRLASGGEALRLTIDNAVQAALEAELSSAAEEYDAIGAAGILMDARNGEIRAMASWPPLNPNRYRDMEREDPAHLNRAVGETFELGSVFKPLTIAAAIEAGAILPTDRFDVSESMTIEGSVIHDFHPLHGRPDVTHILAESSNIGAVKINMMLGMRRQKAFLDEAGLLSRAPVELSGSAAPILPERWDDLSAATISYGHGIAVTPLAFLSAFAALANKGEAVTPTLIVDEERTIEPKRVMSALTADLVVGMLRQAVVSGTGWRAEVAGYRVAGKTGTAEKPVVGGYAQTRNVTSFAAVFPADRPQYALIVVLDEPKGREETKTGQSTSLRRGRAAGWNAAPTAGRIIERAAPLLGIAPRFEDPSRRDDLSVRSVSVSRSEL